MEKLGVHADVFGLVSKAVRLVRGKACGKVKLTNMCGKAGGEI